MAQRADQLEQSLATGFGPQLQQRLSGLLDERAAPGSVPDVQAGHVFVALTTDHAAHCSPPGIAVLHERLNFVMARAERSELDVAEIDNDALHIFRINPAVSECPSLLSESLL